MAIAINRLVARIIGLYDHNNNGKIDLKKPERELERREVTYTHDYTEFSTWSHERLFKAADANGDGEVTAEELTATISKFDENGDGKLETRGWFWNPKQEYEKYDDALGEDLIHQVHVPVVHPPNPPIPPHYYDVVPQPKDKQAAYA